LRNWYANSLRAAGLWNCDCAPLLQQRKQRNGGSRQRQRNWESRRERQSGHPVGRIGRIRRVGWTGWAAWMDAARQHEWMEPKQQARNLRARAWPATKREANQARPCTARQGREGQGSRAQRETPRLPPWARSPGFHAWLGCPNRWDAAHGEIGVHVRELVQTKSRWSKWSSLVICTVSSRKVDCVELPRLRHSYPPTPACPGPLAG